MAPAAAWTPARQPPRVARGERHVIRFKMPKEGAITIHDLLRGDITVENRVLDDTILVKSDGLALYHLAAMVDDHLMDITHVIRGSEWLSTFPLHAHIIRAFGWQEPVWVHLSVFLKPSGKGKMSKRDSAQADARMAIPSLLKTWSPGLHPRSRGQLDRPDGLELRRPHRVLQHARPDREVQPGEAEPLARLPSTSPSSTISTVCTSAAWPAEDLAGRLKPFFEAAGYTVDDETCCAVIPLIRERLATLDDCLSFGGFFFQEEVHPEPEELVGKEMTVAASPGGSPARHPASERPAGDQPESAEEPVRLLAEQLGLKAGQLFGILRVAVTGQTVSPPLFESMASHRQGKSAASACKAPSQILEQAV